MAIEAEVESVTNNGERVDVVVVVTSDGAVVGRHSVPFHAGESLTPEAVTAAILERVRTIARKAVLVKEAEAVAKTMVGTKIQVEKLLSVEPALGSLKA
jgi:hypothetical protein